MHSVIDALRTLIVPIRREGAPFIAICVAGALILFLLAGWLGWLFVILGVWVTYFFRDPKRVVPVRPGLVVSGADGRICHVGEAVPPPELGLGSAPLPRVSVFMNVFNVHMNRAPISGRIRRIAYRPGLFLNADLDKASEDNERNGIVIDTDDGTSIGVVQIAGLVARRIVCFVGEGQSLLAGERIGLIRFGSRVDHYLPAGTRPLVAVGQSTIAGETIIADLALPAAESPRTFIVS